MKNGKWICLVGFLFLLTMTAFAQDEYPKFEVPVGFSFINVHPNQAALTSFNVFGGGGGFVYNFTPLFGIKADFMGAAHTNLDANLCKLEGGCGSGSGNNNAFAMEFGGGLDIPITKTIQFRPVEVDYLYTHFGSNHIAGASASQNNFKYVAGVNFTFGGK